MPNDHPTREQEQLFHEFMASIGFKSQYMVQDEFYMAWPPDEDERHKFGAVCLAPKRVKAIAEYVVKERSSLQAQG